MKELIFYRCEICGNLACMVVSSGMTPSCCGHTMTRLKENVSDGVAEKHVPVIRQNGSNITISIGEIAHPMRSNHYIEWVVLLTDRGKYFQELTVDGATDVEFTVGLTEKVLAAYAYCNIHGLWVKHLDSAGTA